MNRREFFKQAGSLVALAMLPIKNKFGKAKTYQEVVLQTAPDGLVSYWPLDLNPQMGYQCDCVIVDLTS